MGVTLKDALKNLVGDIQVGNVLFTADGGVAHKYINKTGALSVKGTCVEVSDSVANSVKVIGFDELDPIGFIYNSGIADGDDVWVVTNGKAYVLIQDGTTATADYWVRVSATQAGRVDITNAVPPGGTIAALESHLHECGHCNENVTSGIDKLALCTIHFL